MTTIVTRAGKGSSLSWAEMDANLNNLNADKLEASALTPYATTTAVNAGLATKINTTAVGVSVQEYSANLDEYAAVNPTAAGLALLDDADAAAQRVTLGLGTAATATLGTSAGQVPTADQIPSLVSARQIQPISASVSGNALTISASALSLDFRSTTLGSGTITTVSGTPANLVISSGSTLGTVNNVQSDIAVLALNNAGTIELAAVNIAGGLCLDETGLISTTAEGGAGNADSATVVYSTTARTNLAYRVLGIIRSTQTTAGTWVAAPSLIQGSGGQALISMYSLGVGQTWQDFTGSRASGTVYTNTTGRPIAVSVRANTASNSACSVTLVVNGVNMMGSSIHLADYIIGVFGIVPAGNTYSVTLASASIETWAELR